MLAVSISIQRTSGKALPWHSVSSHMYLDFSVNNAKLPLQFGAHINRQ
jgi:hypothetical protein